MVLSVLLWTRFVVAYLSSYGRFGKTLLYGGWLIFTYEIIALIINLFIPIVFGFAEDKEYQPGQARYITLFIQMILFLVTSVYTLVVAVKTDGENKSHHRTVGFSGIVMTIFIALQSLYPLMPLYSIGCLLATCMIHSFVYKDEIIEHDREIAMAKIKSYRDPLTGVKNKLAYIEALKDLEIRVEDGELTKYGMVVFDLNDLKKVNDTKGHDAGDEYIKNACKLICLRFKHSPVFRVGGDEFVAILEGDDYENRTSLIEAFESTAEENKKDGRVVVASGLSIYNSEIDNNYNDVFRRADKKMYERKQLLKAMG
jgi:diguanylate cyclase (GGDEF) domain